MEQYKGVGRDIGVSTRWIADQNLRRFGVDVMDETIVKEVNERGVVVERDGNITLIPADIVVLAVGALPADEFSKELQVKGFELHVIGDAKSPRKITEAIREGFDVALSL